MAFDFEQFANWAEPLVKVLVESTSTKVDDAIFQVWLTARQEGWLGGLAGQLAALPEDAEPMLSAAPQLLATAAKAGVNPMDFLALVQLLLKLWNDFRGGR